MILTKVKVVMYRFGAMDRVIDSIEDKKCFTTIFLSLEKISGMLGFFYMKTITYAFKK